MIGGDVALSGRDRSHKRRGSESITCDGSCRRNWRSEATALVLQEGSRGWVIGGIWGIRDRGNSNGRWYDELREKGRPTA